jgi:hypothetical protein
VTASAGVTAAFLATVLGVAALAGLALARSAPADDTRATWLSWRLGVGLLGWVAIPGGLAAAGLLNRYPLPPPALVVVALTTLGTIAVAWSRTGTRIIGAVPLWLLVGYQVFRIPVELVLHRLYTEGVIPVEMTYAGRNFDIVSGLTAAAVALWIRRGRDAKGLVLLWNLLGLGLLVNIVTIAVLSTPIPIRQFDPPNLLPGLFPYVWLPTVLVQAALLGHLLVFRALRPGHGPPRAEAA